MSYRSPVADILFSLKAVAGLPEMIGAELEGDFDWETLSSVVAEAGRFATEEIAPLNREGDIVGARYENGDCDDAAGIRRRLPALGRGGLGRRLGAGGIRRHGTAAPGQHRLHRNLERRVDGLCALPVADRRRDRRLEGLRLAEPSRRLSAADDRRPLDGHDESDRAPSWIRP